MKRALIVTAFAGFIRSFLTNDIKILQTMGYKVECAANKKHNGSDGIEQFFKDNNVVFHQVDFSSNKPISRETIISYSQLKKIIDQGNYSVVHVHTPITGVLTRVICRKKRRNGMKVIYTTHGFYFHKYSSKKSWLLYRTVEDWMSKYSDAIITINKEDYYNALKMKCKKVFYIPGVGVNIDRFKNASVNKSEYREALGIDDDDFVILAVGELSERKNHKIIVEALSLCKIKKATFVICGNAMTQGNTRDYLKNLAKEKGVDLRLMGLRNDIPEICKCADVGVMPSLREGLGLSGIEMLASGIPLVASNVHGIVDYMKDGVNGYLINPNNSKEVADAILKLKNRLVYEDFTTVCYESVEKFDIKHSCEEIARIYKELLGNELS